MKVLLDSCVWGGARLSIQLAGHDVIWAGDWLEDPGDDVILARAHGEQRVLVTLDKDFGELAILQNRPHSGILRVVNFPAQRQADVILRVLSLHGAELSTGAFVTAEPGRLRVRPADQT